MPVVVIGLCILFIVYDHLWFIVGWVLIVGLAYGFCRLIMMLTPSQDTQTLRRPVPSRLAAKLPVDDEPLDDLTDDEPPRDIVTEEVRDALENEAAWESGRDGEERVDCILGQTVEDHLSDIYLEDDRGLTQVDHVAKMPWGLVVIETKNYGGFISRTRNPRRWKQSFRHFGSQKFYIFQNPFDQNHRHTSAVSYVTGLNENVFSLVVFAGRARTSRSVHDEIVRIRMLKTAIHRRPKASYIPGRKRDEAWEKLKQHAIANRGRKEEHLAGLKRKIA